MNWSDISDQLRTDLVNEVKSNLSSEINKSIIYVYWNIGKIIVSNENEFDDSYL